MKLVFAYVCCLCFFPLWGALAAENGAGLALVGSGHHDLGVFKDSEAPQTAFLLCNGGKESLRITDIRKTCGCASAVADRDVIGPGGTGTVRVVVEPYTLEGAFTKSVFVLTDAPGAAPLSVTFSGTCVPLFSVRPSKTVDTGRLPFGAKWEGTFEVDASEPVVLGDPAVTSACPGTVSIERMASPDGRPRWRIPVTVSPSGHGAFRYQAVFPVLSPNNRPPLVLEVAGRAGASLFAVPSVLEVPPVDEPAVRTVRLRLSGVRGRRLEPSELCVEPEVDGVEIQATPEPGGGLAVRVTVSPGLSRRLAGDGPVKMVFGVSGAGTAEMLIRLSPQNTQKGAEK